MTNRLLTFIYGALSYALFFATFLYAIGFVGNFAVHKSLDSVSGGAWTTALLVDLGSLALFAVAFEPTATPPETAALAVSPSAMAPRPPALPAMELLPSATLP